ncbi:MAG: hypothetical protein ABH956_02835 [Candidatus Nealsonbacteria bacterium]
MAIEIDSRMQIKKLFWPFVFITVCLSLFLILLGTYFYFGIASKKIVDDIEKKNKELITSPSEKILEQEVFLYESKINNFKKVFSNHQKVLNVFSFLEQVTHPDILFSDFSFDSSTRAINVSGKAEDFTSLGQQLLIFKQIEILKNINLSGISINDEGEIDFSFQFTFLPQSLKEE